MVVMVLSVCGRVIGFAQSPACLYHVVEQPGAGFLSLGIVENLARGRVVNLLAPLLQLPWCTYGTSKRTMPKGAPAPSDHQALDTQGEQRNYRFQ